MTAIASSAHTYRPPRLNLSLLGYSPLANYGLPIDLTGMSDVNEPPASPDPTGPLDITANLPSLPSELMNLIFSFVALGVTTEVVDRSRSKRRSSPYCTLASACLVSKNFLSLARPYLYRHIQINICDANGIEEGETGLYYMESHPGTDQLSSDSAKLLQTLRSSPAIALLIKSLTFNDATTRVLDAGSTSWNVLELAALATLASSILEHTINVDSFITAVGSDACSVIVQAINASDIPYTTFTPYRSTATRWTSILQDVRLRHLTVFPSASSIDDSLAIDKYVNTSVSLLSTHLLSPCHSTCISSLFEHSFGTLTTLSIALDAASHAANYTLQLFTVLRKLSIYTDDEDEHGGDINHVLQEFFPLQPSPPAYTTLADLSFIGCRPLLLSTLSFPRIRCLDVADSEVSFTELQEFVRVGEGANLKVLYYRTEEGAKGPEGGAWTEQEREDVRVACLEKSISGRVLV